MITNLNIDIFPCLFVHEMEYLGIVNTDFFMSRKAGLKFSLSKIQCVDNVLWCIEIAIPG